MLLILKIIGGFEMGLIHEIFKLFTQKYILKFQLE
jgi:hypothetical protein